MVLKTPRSEEALVEQQHTLLHRRRAGRGRPHHRLVHDGGDETPESVETPSRPRSSLRRRQWSRPPRLSPLRLPSPHRPRAGAAPEACSGACCRRHPGQLIRPTGQAETSKGRDAHRVTALLVTLPVDRRDRQAARPRSERSKPHSRKETAWPIPTEPTPMSARSRRKARKPDPTSRDRPDRPARWAACARPTRRCPLRAGPMGRPCSRCPGVRRDSRRDHRHRRHEHGQRAGRNRVPDGNLDRRADDQRPGAQGSLDSDAPAQAGTPPSGAVSETPVRRGRSGQRQSAPPAANP